MDKPKGAGKGVRSSLNLLTKMVRHGETTADMLPDFERFIDSVLDDPNASNRDRLAAMKLRKEVLGMALGAASDLDKIERLDDGGPTEITQTYEIKFDNKG